MPSPTALSEEDYRIGPDDLLKIDVFQVAELSRQVRVNSRGEISLPLVGTVRVAGLTGQELEALLAHRLAERYLVDPQVYVFIEEFISQRVTVEGRVKQPGVYPLKGPTTLLQVIAMSQGIEELGDTERIQMFRPGADGKKQAYFFNIEAIRKGEARDPVIKADDIIIVYEDGGKAFTQGLVETLRGLFSIGIGGTVPLF
jgi:polysaccharide export outer membrane protein